MSYVPGDSDVSINTYLLYLRTHRTKVDVTDEQELKAMLWDFALGAIDVNLIADVTTINTIFGVDSSGGVVSLNLALLTPVPVDDDVLIFYVVDDTAQITIQDTDDLGSPGTDVVFASGVSEGKATAWKFSTSDGYWSEYVRLNDTGDQKREFTNIGECEEKPYAKTGEGESKKLSSGTEKDISESLEFWAKDLQVNKDNDTFLRSELPGANIDAVFYCKVEGTVYAAKTIRLYDIPFNSLLTIMGNDVNFNEIVSKKDVPNADDYMKLGYDV